MSNQVNTLLLEQAGDLIDYYEGTYVARVLRRDVEANDLEALKFHVSEYQAQRFMEEERELLHGGRDEY